MKYNKKCFNNVSAKKSSFRFASQPNMVQPSRMMLPTRSFHGFFKISFRYDHKSAKI